MLTLERRDQVGELGWLLARRGESRSYPAAAHTSVNTQRSRHRIYTREATAFCPRARPCKVCEMGETPIGTFPIVRTQQWSRSLL